MLSIYKHNIYSSLSFVNTFLLKINIFSFLRQYCVFIKHKPKGTQLKCFK